MKLWHHRENGAGKHAVVPPRHIVVFRVGPFPPISRSPKTAAPRYPPGTGRCEWWVGQFPGPVGGTPPRISCRVYHGHVHLPHEFVDIFLRSAIRRADILPQHLPVTRVSVADLHLRRRGGKGDRSCGRHHSIRMRAPSTRTRTVSPMRCHNPVMVVAAGPHTSRRNPHRSRLPGCLLFPTLRHVFDVADVRPLMNRLTDTHTSSRVPSALGIHATDSTIAGVVNVDSSTLRDRAAPTRAPSGPART